MKKSIATKILSVTTSVALLATSFTGTAGAAMPAAAPGPDFVRALTPAENLGSVVSSYDAGGSKMPRLIVIADLHGHLGVQNNIIGMLEKYVKTLNSNKEGASEKRVPIFVEGGWSDHLEAPLKSVKQPNVRAFLGNYLFQKSEIPAAQAFSERHADWGNFTLTGVENKAEYEANRARFAETYPVRKAILEALVRQEQPLAVLRQHVENHAFDKLYAMRQDYLKGTVSEDQYATALLRQATRLGIQNGYVNILRKGDSENGKFDLALTVVHRQVSQRLTDARPIESYIRTPLKNEAVIRKNLGYIDGYLDLLKRVVGNQLTPEEVPYAYAAMPHLIEVAQMLLADEKLNIDLGTAIQQSMDFYPFAFLRDETLVKNSVTAMEKDPTHPETGILIAGGFHTGAIGQYLREHQISYLMINPTVDRDITAQEQLNYIKRICNEHVTLAEVVQDVTHPRNQQLARQTAIAPQVNLQVESLPNLMELPVVATLSQKYPALGTWLASGAKPADQPAELKAALGSDAELQKVVEAALKIASAGGNLPQGFREALDQMTPEQQMEWAISKLVPYVGRQEELNSLLGSDTIHLSKDLAEVNKNKGQEGHLWVHVPGPVFAMPKLKQIQGVNKTAKEKAQARLGSVKEVLADYGISGDFTKQNAGITLEKQENGLYKAVEGLTEKERKEAENKVNQIVKNNQNSKTPEVLYYQTGSFSTRYQIAGAKETKVSHEAFEVTSADGKVGVMVVGAHELKSFATNIEAKALNVIGDLGRFSLATGEKLRDQEKAIHEAGHAVATPEIAKNEIQNTLHGVKDTLVAAAIQAGKVTTSGDLDQSRISLSFVNAVLQALNPDGSREEVNALSNTVAEHAEATGQSYITTGDLASLIGTTISGLMAPPELQEQNVQELAQNLEQKTGLDPQAAKLLAQRTMDNSFNRVLYFFADEKERINRTTQKIGSEEKQAEAATGDNA